MQINVSVTDANNIVCEVVPPQPQVIVIDRGVEGNGIVSIVPVTISTFQYLRITYTNGTVQDVGPLTSTAYTATSPITIVGNTISLATVPIASGGTDATTAAGAIQNLLPSYTGNANKRLGLNSGGTALEWVADGGGTVTSINASGGTTGLSFTGGPITSSGTLTLSGTLAIANGGTGQITANAAFNALAPSQTGNSGKYLTTDGTDTSWATNPLGTVTSVAATVPSFLSVSGSPITTSGTLAITYSGTALPIANGGTGQTTANAALNALLPTQTGNASKYLQTDGTNATWDAISLSTADITGILPTANGGTGLSSFTANGVVYASSTSALATGTALTFNGTNLTFGSTGQRITGDFSTGTDANRLSFQSSTTNGFTQINAIPNGTSQVSGFTAFNNSDLTNAAYLRILPSATEARFQSGITGTGTYLPLTMYTGGSERLRLDISGNLGLGIAPAAYSESSKFTINATGKTNGIYINFNGTGADKQILLTNGGSANCFVGTDNTAMTLGTGNTERMRIDSAGTLFVNTTGRPSGIGGGDNGKLWVKQTTTGNYGISSIASATDSFISIANTGTVGLIGTSYGTTGSYLPLAFYTSDLERARITASGDFGIGTSSPASRLHVSGTFGSQFRLQETGGTFFDIASGGRFDLKNNAGTTIVSIAQSGSPVGTQLNLDSSGNLSVGTTSIASSGQSSSITTNTVLAVKGSLVSHTTSAGIFEWNSNKVGIRAYGATAGSGYISFNVGGGGGSADFEAARFDTSGNLGIGTSSPANKLSVYAGGIVANFGAYGTGAYDDIELQAYSGYCAIGTRGSTPLLFNIARSEKMRLDTSGNLGLGITPNAWSPRAIQVGSWGGIQDMNGVANQIAFRGNLYYNSGDKFLNASGYANTIALDATNGILFYTSTAASTSANSSASMSQRMTLGTNGNLLVGATSQVANNALSKIAVIGNSDSSSTTIKTFPQGLSIANPVNANTSGYGVAMRFQFSTDSDGIGKYAAIAGIATSNYANSTGLAFYTTDNAAGGVDNVTERMRLDSSGNLGVGTTNPTSRLHVSGTGTVREKLASTNGAVELQLISDTQANASYSNIYCGDGTNWNWRIGGSNGSSNIMTFDTGGSERVRISSVGNLGISTTATDFKVTTQGFAAYTNNTNNTDGTADAQRNGIGWVATGGSQVLGSFITAANQGSWGSDIQFFTRPSTGGNAFERARITATGNLLIGTTQSNPYSGFEIGPNAGASFQTIGHATGTASGSAYMNFNYNQTGCGSITQNGTSAVLYNTSSDYRLKNITGALTGYKERLMSLQPKQGTWKADGSEFRGFLAHEFAEPYSASVSGEKDAVDADNKPIMQAMQASSSEVMADLVAMVKDLIAENDSLKARLDAANL